MEAAGPSMRYASPTQSTSQPSPKKSPKKKPNRAAKFKQNSNNSSPKRSINDPSSLNPQNIPFSTPMSNQNQAPATPTRNNQNDPHSSPNRSKENPVSGRFYKSYPFTAAIENHQKKPSAEFPAIQSLMITVHNNAVPYQRTVQEEARPSQAIVNDDVQPPRVVPNESQGLASDVTSKTPYQSKFPQRPFKYEPPHKRSTYSEKQKKRNSENMNVQPQSIAQSDVFPQHILSNDVHPQRFLPKDVQPPRIVQNDGPSQRIVQNDIHSPRIVRNDIQPRQIPQIDLQPYAIIQNDVQPRIVQNDVQPRIVQNAMQAQGTLQNNMIPGQSYQRSLNQSRQYDVPNRGERRSNNKSIPPLYDLVQHLEQVNGEYQIRPNWRQRKVYEQEPDSNKKVVVSGFPAYTKPEELVRKLSVLGHAQLETYKGRVALVTFNTEQEALDAVQANETIAVYGTILTIIKYTGRKQLMTMIKANKRVIKNEGGPPIIAPAKLDLSGDFSQQVQNIEDAIRLTQEEVAKINLLFEDIEMYMRKIFPTCEAVPFGSITTGQGIKSSDADCFLSMVPGTEGRPGEGAAELCSQFVSRAARVLRLYPEVFSRLVAIPRANTPIIKFLHVPTNVNCDLNSKTPLGVQNSRLIGHLLRHDPRFGSVALLIKYWARVHQLSGTGRLTNYALLLLLVFYLQQNLLPPVCSLQGPAHSFLIENWEAGFDHSPLPFLRESPPLRDLLGGFFLYYAGFNFDDLVVCPLVGKPLRKAQFESNVLPPQYALYQQNIKNGLALQVRTNSSICIQDPLELSHNVASAVSGRLANEIKAFIKLAATAYSQDEETPGDFLRTILLSRPPQPETVDSRIRHRMSFPTRLLVTLGDNWRQTMREILVNQLFRDVLMLELIREDSVSREADVESEVYHCLARRPVWRRPQPAPRGAMHSPRELLLTHRDISDTILNRSPHLQDVHLPFEVELLFRSKPRCFTISIASLDGADEEEFKLFRIFINTFLHRWHIELVRPHIPEEAWQALTDDERRPKNSPKRSPKRAMKKEKIWKELIGRKPVSEKPPKPQIETVAFVNSNHRDLNDSLAGMSLTDTSK